MGLFDALNSSKHAMTVHRFRVEVAAQNVSNAYTPGYVGKSVNLKANDFKYNLDNNSTTPIAKDGKGNGSINDASEGAVSVASVVADRGGLNERQQALLATKDMMQSKSAFELSSRAVTMIKSMMQATLEINRQ